MALRQLSLAPFRARPGAGHPSAWRRHRPRMPASAVDFFTRALSWSGYAALWSRLLSPLSGVRGQRRVPALVPRQKVASRLLAPRRLLRRLFLVVFLVNVLYARHAASNSASARACSPSMCRVIDLPAPAGSARRTCRASPKDPPRGSGESSLSKFSSSCVHAQLGVSSATYGWSLPTFASRKARPSVMGGPRPSGDAPSAGRRGSRWARADRRRIRRGRIAGVEIKVEVLPRVSRPSTPSAHRLGNADGTFPKRSSGAFCPNPVGKARSGSRTIPQIDTDLPVSLSRSAPCFPWNS